MNENFYIKYSRRLTFESIVVGYAKMIILFLRNRNLPSKNQFLCITCAMIISISNKLHCFHTVDTLMYRIS